MNIEHLVRMANDIGAFFSGEPDEDATRDIHFHLRRFWEPRMRTQIVAHYRTGGAGLDQNVRAAVALLAAEEEKKAAAT